MAKLNEEEVYCNKCLHETRHEVIAERKHVTPDYDEMGQHVYDWETTYSMLQCMGCRSVTLRKLDNSGYSDLYQEVFYPPRIARRQAPWMKELPPEFKSLIVEIYGALQSDSRRLALMGARTLVDLFMNKTVTDIGGFAKKLSRLVEEGYLSEKDREVLEVALEASHAVSHRGYKPNTEDVNLVFDIVENLIQKLVLKSKIKALRKKTPKRKIKKTKTGT